MCQYCTYVEDGWSKLLEYDTVYQTAIAGLRDTGTHGFQESWDELREDLAF
ncbi:hypothetical protein ACNS7O_13190 [Haloferacaceae archaeon DSL9]